MPAYKRILLATDFAESSTAAREYAGSLAEVYGAELHVLYVQVLLADSYGWSGYHGLAEADRALAETAKQHSAAPEAGDAKVIEVTRRDVAAAPSILAYAEEHDINLIIMGTHRRRGVARWFMGSVSGEVVRSATVPVLVVGPEHGYLGQSGCILAAVDFSESSLNALRAAADVANEADVKLVALHVIEPLNLPPYYTSEFQEAERTDAHGALEETIASLNLPAKAEVVVASGRPHDQINETAREQGAGLIVMGTQGLHGLERALVGSVADRVLRTAPCPVLAHR